MKKLLLLTASMALIAGGCGAKDKVDTSKVENAAEKVAAKAGDAKDAMVEKAGDAKEAVADKMGDAKDAMTDKMDDAKDYGSGEKEESHGSDSAHMDFSDADRKMMVKSCVDDGQMSAEGCACSVKVMEGGLSKETLMVVVNATKVAAKDGDAAGEKYMMDNMSQAQGMEFFGVMPKLMECDPKMADVLNQQ